MYLLILVLSDILIFCFLYIIASLSLNFQYGYAGIPNFGLSLSVAGGGYVVGFLTGRLAMAIYPVDPNLDFITDNLLICTLINSKLQSNPLTSMLIFLVVVAVAVLVGAALGLVSAYPAIRLEYSYLVMTLTAFANMVVTIGFYYPPICGGTLGIHVPSPFAWFGEAKRLGVTIVFFAFVILVFFLLRTIVNSPFGRLIRAIRDNETAAESLGKDVVKIKIKVIVFSSAIASLTGALWGFYTSSVVATAFTTADWTFFPWLMMMIGGSGNNTGALLGAVVFTFTRRIIIMYKHHFRAYIPFSVAWFELILMGVALILIMLIRPEGILPEKPTRIRVFSDGVRHKIKLYVKKLFGHDEK